MAGDEGTIALNKERRKGKKRNKKAHNNNNNNNNAKQDFHLPKLKQ